MMVSPCTRSILSAHARSLGKNMESSEEERPLRAADCPNFLGVCVAMFQDEGVPREFCRASQQAPAESRTYAQNKS